MEGRRHSPGAVFFFEKPCALHTVCLFHACSIGYCCRPSRPGCHCPAIMQLAKQQPVPEFDVKIIASRRYVIWKDPKNDKDNGDNAKEAPKVIGALPASERLSLEPREEEALEDVESFASENEKREKKDEEVEETKSQGSFSLPPIEVRTAMVQTQTPLDPPKETPRRQSSFDEQPLPALQQKARMDLLQVPSAYPEETTPVADSQQNVDDVGGSKYADDDSIVELDVDRFKRQSSVSKESDESSNDKPYTGRSKYMKKEMQPVGVVAGLRESDSEKLQMRVRKTQSSRKSVLSRRRYRKRQESKSSHPRPKSFSVLEPIGVSVQGKLVYPKQKRKKSSAYPRQMDVARWSSPEFCEPDPEGRPRRSRKRTQSEEMISTNRRASQDGALRSKSFTVLPPITPESLIAQGKILDKNSEHSLRLYINEGLAGVNSRTMQAILIEMRNQDRDRDGILTISHVTNIFRKCQVPLDEETCRMLFAKFLLHNGMVDYEKMMGYMNGCKADPPSIIRSRHSPPSGDMQTARRMFAERDVAKLIIDLERTLMTSEIDRLRRAMTEVDHEGKGFISRGQIEMALRRIELSLPGDLLHRWLAATEKSPNNLYPILNLLSFFERVRPDAHSLLTGHGPMSAKKSPKRSSTSAPDGARWEDGKRSSQGKFFDDTETARSALTSPLSFKSHDTMASKPDVQWLANFQMLAQGLMTLAQGSKGLVPINRVQQLVSTYDIIYGMKLKESEITNAISQSTASNDRVNIEKFLQVLGQDRLAKG